MSLSHTSCLYLIFIKTFFRLNTLDTIFNIKYSLFVNLIGMELCVHNYIDATRLAKLTSLQEKFLKHAMNAFPKAKRIVYSTCSLFPEENERVITNVVKASRAKWKVQDIKELLKGQWNNFGSSMYGSMGTRCMYAKTDSDFTIGFFLAVLDRDPKDAEKSQNKEYGKPSTENITISSIDNEELNDNYESYTKKNKKRKHTDTSEEIQIVDVTEVGKKKKKKKKRSMAENSVDEKTENKDIYDEPSESQIADISLETGKKKKKKNKRQNVGEHNSATLVEITDVIQQETKKKKKKRKDVTNGNAVEASDTLHETNAIDCIEEPAKKKKHKHKNLIETAED